MNKCDYFTGHSADSGTFLKLITLQTRFTSSCFPVVNEKQGLSVTLITRRFLQCQFTVCLCYYSLQLEVKLRHTNELYTQFNVSCNHP